MPITIHWATPALLPVDGDGQAHPATPSPNEAGTAECQDEKNMGPRRRRRARYRGEWPATVFKHRG